MGEQVIGEFVMAFNQGDQARLQSLLPSEASSDAVDTPHPGMDQRGFRAFSINQQVFDSRDDVLQHFVERHASDAQLELQDLVVETDQQDFDTPELLFFFVQVVRQADNLIPHTAVGKGAVNCIDRTILYWFTGDSGEEVLDHSVLTGAKLPGT